MAINLSNFKGSYALITGASSGLGFEFAQEFAKLGMNLILVARNQSRLDQTANDLKAKYKIEVMNVSLDMSDMNSPQKLYDLLKEKNIKISLLCNNVASGYLGDFHSLSLIETQKMLTLNQTSMVSLAHLFINDLAAHSRSAIINVSSAAAFQPIPYMSVYGASKAFVHNFSLALHWELKEKGIYVQTLTPGVIDTEFNQKIGIDMKKMKNVKTPNEVVQASLQGFNHEEIMVKATSGILLQKFFANFFPTQMVLREVAKMFKGAAK